MIEDAELSRLLSDLAISDPAFESSLSEGVGRNGHVGILAEALPTTVLQASAREAVARLLRVSVFPRILETCRGQDRWQRGVQQCRVFKQLHGHLMVPLRYTFGGFRLGSWVRQIRAANSKGLLTSTQKKILLELGFVWNVWTQKQEKGIRAIEKYKSEHGHVLVPQKHETSDGFNLGVWVSQKRFAKSKDNLSDEQIQRLDDLGFIWDVLEHLWEQRIKRLQAYKSEHGHVLVPFDYETPDGFKLGVWVSQKRVAKSKGKLGDEQIKRLDDLGFVWDVLEHLWEQAINRLQAYRSEHGHVLVPVEYETSDGFKLGVWVNKKRVAKSKGKLGDEQIKRLDDLGFVWDVLEHLWEQAINRLQAYKSEHGHVLVPVDYETSEGFKLGVWVNKKRVAKSKGKLGDEQIKRLDDLGFVWNVFEHSWEQGINRLQAYKSEHGHVLVPQEYETSDGFNLGVWVSQKRFAKSKDNLSDEQIQRLDDLGFIWDVLEHLWEQRIKRLQAYKSEHGHVLVPFDYETSDGFKLGVWVSQKRVAKSKGKLGDEQIQRLDDLGFVWDVLEHLWEQGINRLQAYKSEHGHVLVPFDYETSDGFKLGVWVSQKRVAKSKGKLGDEQIQRLDDLGFVWDVLEHSWEQGINRLEAYKSKHGHVLVPRKHETSDGFKLGFWVNNKRVAKSKGKLGDEQTKRLDDLGFV